MSPPFDRWVSTVSAARKAYRLPAWAQAAADEFVASALALLFPQFAPHGRSDPHAVRSEVQQLKALLARCVDGFGQDGQAVAAAFVNTLPEVHDALVMDATATFEADPTVSYPPSHCGGGTLQPLCPPANGDPHGARPRNNPSRCKTP